MTMLTTVVFVLAATLALGGLLATGWPVGSRGDA